MAHKNPYRLAMFLLGARRCPLIPPRNKRKPSSLPPEKSGAVPRKTAPRVPGKKHKRNRDPVDRDKGGASQGLNSSHWPSEVPHSFVHPADVCIAPLSPAIPPPRLNEVYIKPFFRPVRSSRSCFIFFVWAPPPYPRSACLIIINNVKGSWERGMFILTRRNESHQDLRPGR